MAFYVGTVIFSKPLVWENEPEPNIVAYDQRVIDGGYIRTTYDNPSTMRLAIVHYTWVPYVDIETLLNMAAARTQYPANLKNSGADITVAFAAKDGMSRPEPMAGPSNEVPRVHVAGTRLDLFRGTMRLIIVG